MVYAGVHAASFECAVYGVQVPFKPCLDPSQAGWFLPRQLGARTVITFRYPLPRAGNLRWASRAKTTVQRSLS